MYIYINRLCKNDGTLHEQHTAISKTLCALHYYPVHIYYVLRYLDLERAFLQPNIVLSQSIPVFYVLSAKLNCSAIFLYLNTNWQR